ncbi:cilia- and flagella-associated protein 57 isoform X3 [Patella vulgata]|uniref:cilia- and flagella-associated protein 57 isoform X3 n=1 Tax=Patella vulgata TaxID=6465 RepID=UPI0024A83163|nr:cilia- and flagella-associated protein 57 isoform X3 [Patella vulgata]
MTKGNLFRQDTCITSAMASDNMKDLQKQFENVAARSKYIENDFKKLAGAKKEKDKKSATDSVLKQISQTVPLVHKLEERLEKTKHELQTSTNKTEDEQQKTKQKNDTSSDDSVLTYELKAQLMKNVQVQNERLKMELALQEKVDELKLINEQKCKLQEDCNLSRNNSMKLVNMFERKAKEECFTANSKLQAMQEELKKSHELTNRYRDLYESERQKQRSQGATSKSGNKTDKEETKFEGINNEESKKPVKVNPVQENPHIRQEAPNFQSMLSHGVRVNDIIRKNECLSQENVSLQKEVSQLRHENIDLMKRAKESMTDRDTLLKQQLERSITKQAADWIQRKKQVQQYEDEFRWSQVGHVSSTGEQRSRSPYKS